MATEQSLHRMPCLFVQVMSFWEAFQRQVVFKGDYKTQENDASLFQCVQMVKRDVFWPKGRPYLNQSEVNIKNIGCQIFVNGPCNAFLH